MKSEVLTNLSLNEPECMFVPFLLHKRASMCLWNKQSPQGEKRPSGYPSYHVTRQNRRRASSLSPATAVSEPPSYACSCTRARTRAASPSAAPAGGYCSSPHACCHRRTTVAPVAGEASRRRRGDACTRMLASRKGVVQSRSTEVRASQSRMQLRREDLVDAEAFFPVVRC